MLTIRKCKEVEEKRRIEERMEEKMEKMEEKMEEKESIDLWKTFATK